MNNQNKNTQVMKESAERQL